MLRCEGCGKEFKGYSHRGRYARFCSKICFNHRPLRGSVWEGNTGYIYFQRGRGKKQLLHRILTNASKSQIVHHRDGNPSNNDLDNLVVLSSQAEHGKFHRLVLGKK